MGGGTVTLYTCCRHCSPQHPAHPATPDSHDKPCGPAWCSESVAVTDTQLHLWEAS